MWGDEHRSIKFTKYVPFWYQSVWQLRVKSFLNENSITLSSEQKRSREALKKVKRGNSQRRVNITWSWKGVNLNPHKFYKKLQPSWKSRNIFWGEKNHLRFEYQFCWTEDIHSKRLQTRKLINWYWYQLWIVDLYRLGQQKIWFEFWDIFFLVGGLNFSTLSHFEVCEACVAKRLADLFLCLGVTAMALGWALRRIGWGVAIPEFDWWKKSSTKTRKTHEKLGNDRINYLSNWCRISFNSMATDGYGLFFKISHV